LRIQRVDNRAWFVSLSLNLAVKEAKCFVVKHSIDSRFTAGNFIGHGPLKNRCVVNNPFVVVEAYLRNFP
jgi:hypothetical protein